jgi:hypothetical protein
MLITTLLFFRGNGGQASRQQRVPPHSTSSTPSANSNNSTPLKPAPPPKPTSLLTPPGGGANIKATPFNRLPLPSAASAAQSTTPLSYSSAKRHQQQSQPGANSGARQNKSAGLLQQQRQQQQPSPRAERKARLGSSGANSPTGGQSPRLTPRHIINGGRTSSTVVSSSSSSSDLATTSRLQRLTTTTSGARNGAVLSSRLPSPGGLNMMATMTSLANGGIESAPRGKNNSTPVVAGGGTVSSSPKRGHSNNNRLLKAEAHRVLADQLSRGRIAPKAKFRADDEISIGEPSVMVSSPRTVSYASEERDLALPGRGEEEDGEGPASDSLRQQSQPRVVGGGSPDRKYQLEVKQQRQLSTTQQQQQQHNSNSVKGAPQRLSLPQPPGSSGVRAAATTVGKSASLDNYYNSANSSNSSNNAANKSKIQSAKSSGVTLLQRLSSLRLSFNSHDRRGGGGNSSPYKITPHLTDSDSGFFAGIAAAGGKRRPLAPYEVRHGPNLVVTPLVELHKAPPKRRRPKRRQGCSNGGGGRNPERSYSFTDAQFIAQAVVEGDTALIEELYPSFPASSDPIYTVIKKNRRARSSLLTAGGDGARTMTAIVRPSFLSDCEARGSSLVHPAERQPMTGEERSPRASSCATGGRCI